VLDLRARALLEQAGKCQQTINTAQHAHIKIREYMHIR
jgi:hypothetical protein